MSLTLVTAPTEEPLEISDAMAALRIDDNTESPLVASYIAAARDHAERSMGLALLPQTWKYTADEFPRCGDDIILGKPPLTAVTSVKYIDQAGVEQTLPTDQYVVDIAHPLGRISTVYGFYWPYTRVQAAAVNITFTAGYADPDAVPAIVKAWMLKVIGSLYRNRETTIDAVMQADPELAGMLNAGAVATWMV